MKLRRFLVFLFIILMAVSLKLPGVYNMLGLSTNIMDADAEVRSSEEFEAVIYDVIREVKDNIKIKIVRYDENAGLGFIAGCNSSVTTTLGKEAAVIELKLQYYYSGEKVAAMRRAADSKANDIINKIIKPGMSDYEKVLAVHDYVIKSSRYDRLNAESDTLPPEEHEAYGVLVEGIGVCDSYAKAVKLLLEKAGVQCMLVEGSKAGTTGQRPSEVDHAWNIVRIDGEYYHVDATWDDVSEERDSIELLYHYLNLSDEEMQKTHIWDKSRYPACTGTKYNYFIYSKLFAKDYAETLSMLVKAISDREEKLIIKISDYKSTKYNIEELIKKAAEKSRLKQGIGAKWIINESLGIVDIEFEY